MLLLLNRNTQLSFYFYMLSIFYFLFSRVFFLILFSLLLSRNLGKKDDTKKTCPPLQSLVRISAARANAHNTIAHFRHTQVTKIKIARLEQLAFL